MTDSVKVGINLVKEEELNLRKKGLIIDFFYQQIKGGLSREEIIQILCRKLELDLEEIVVSEYVDFLLSKKGLILMTVREYKDTLKCSIRLKDENIKEVFNRSNFKEKQLKIKRKEEGALKIRVKEMYGSGMTVKDISRKTSKTKKEIKMLLS